MDGGVGTLGVYVLISTEGCRWGSELTEEMAGVSMIGDTADPRQLSSHGTEWRVDLSQRPQH